MESSEIDLSEFQEDNRDDGDGGDDGNDGNDQVDAQPRNRTPEPASGIAGAIQSPKFLRFYFI